MTQKETNLRSVLFLVIGILLLLSLIICIYIVSAESDLIKISAEVVEVDTKRTSTGKVKLLIMMLMVNHINMIIICIKEKCK